MHGVFSTKDALAATIAAYDKFTHVVVGRAYSCTNPVYFKSAGLVQFPVFFYADWDTRTHSQLDKWRKKEGILIDSSNRCKLGDADARILVDSPLSLSGLALEDCPQVVITKPVSWQSHIDTINVKYPSGELCRQFAKGLHDVPERAKVAEASRFPGSLIVLTDSELSTHSGLTVRQIHSMRRTFEGSEVWAIRMRLRPEDALLTAVWDELEKVQPFRGTRYCMKVRGLGVPWRRALREMGRLGNITATKFYVYPSQWVDIDRAQKAHVRAMLDFQELQRFVEKLPEYPT